MENTFAREVVGLTSNQRAVVANGMITAPFDEEDEIVGTDFALTEKVVESRGAAVIAPHVDKWEPDKDGATSDVVMRSFALVLKHAVQRRRTWIVLGDDKHSTVTLVAEESKRRRSSRFLITRYQMQDIG